MGRRPVAYSVHMQLLWGLAVIAMLAVGLSKGKVPDATAVSEIKVEGQWNEVKKSHWPLDDVDYFVATDKGHHFVELTRLKKHSEKDLLVTFEYYYSYAKTRPVLQMTPCRKNIYLVDENSEESRNKWIQHTQRVSHKDCNERNSLAYNVLLHDAGDVFAWKRMEVEYVEEEVPPPENQTKQPSTESETESTTVGGADAENGLPENQESSSAEQRPKPASPDDRPHSEGTEKTSDHSGSSSSSSADGQKDGNTLFEQEQADHSASSDAQESQVKPLESQSATSTDADESQQSNDAKNQKTPKAEPSHTSQDPKASRGGQSQSDTQSSTEGAKESRTSEATLTSPRTDEPQTEESPTTKPTTEAPQGTASSASPFGPSSTHEPDWPKPDENTNHEVELATPQQTEGDPKRPQPTNPAEQVTRVTDGHYTSVQARKKRDTGKPASRPKEVCRPSSCNKDAFLIERFVPLVRGLPKIPADRVPQKDTKYYVNLKNKPLMIKLAPAYQPSLADVDSCIDMWIYMERDTEFELSIEGLKNGKPLEKVKRSATDSTANKWDQFSRCLSDYVPRYSAAKRNPTDNSLKFVVTPSRNQKPGQMATLIDLKRAGSLRELYPLQSFVPDLSRISGTSQLKKYWVLDRDGLEKPHYELVQKGTSKVLQISKIDPTQSEFDITSRWMKIKDAETLEQPLLFVYKAEEADWIERIDLEFQRAGDDDWMSKRNVYVNRNQNRAEMRDDKDKDKRGLIDLPIRLKGADSDEFRIRVRHHVKQATAAPPAAGSDANQASTSQAAPAQIIPVKRAGDLSLNVKSLAFGDVCAYARPYCQNKGVCKATGAAQAECVCARGHSGRFCERVRPCDVVYGPEASAASSLGVNRSASMTGHEICNSVGARCIDQLPVMRCEWPNDKYYQCKKLYKFDANTESYMPVSTRPLSNNEQTNAATQLTTQNGAGAPGTGSAGTETSSNSGAGEPTEPPPPPEGQAVDPFDELEPEEQVRRLKETNQEQKKLIIILAVFLVALLVFAVVLVGSMVSRLRVSSSRLKKSQSELHEMARRGQPGRYNAAARGAHAPGSGPIGYNNSAFDVDL
jgi:hypothetical protein